MVIFIYYYIFIYNKLPIYKVDENYFLATPITFYIFIIDVSLQFYKPHYQITFHPAETRRGRGFYFKLMGESNL